MRFLPGLGLIDFLIPWIENKCRVSADSVTVEGAHCPLRLSHNKRDFYPLSRPGSPLGWKVPESRAMLLSFLSFLWVSPVPTTAVGV